MFLMPFDTTGKLGQGQTGLSFANAVRGSLQCGVIFVDEHQHCFALTSETLELLGLDAGPAGDFPLSKLAAPLQQLVRETFKSGKAINGRPLELDLPSATTKKVFVNISPMPAARQKGLLVVLKDVSPAKQFEPNIWQLDRLATIGTLSASMAHEIKNALVAGRTFVELLIEKHHDTELTEVVRRELGRIDTIVSRVLNFAGAPNPSGFDTVGIHELLEHSLKLVQPHLESKGIALERSFMAKPDAVNGDSNELQQAFVNLLLNAVESMGSQGVLTVATEITKAKSSRDPKRASSSAPMIQVSIKDTGTGISHEAMTHLFEPFFTTKPAGTGLGLPITQRLIEEHRGTISVQSAPGQGATFQVVLPATSNHKP